MLLAVLVAMLFAFGAAPDDVPAIEKQLAAGDYRAALASLEAIPKEQRGARWSLLASKAYDGLNDPARAVEQAQRAIGLDPRSDGARLQLAQIFLSRNTPQPAYEILHEAAPLFPRSALIRFGLGLALNGLQRYADAIPVLQECLRLKPDLAAAFDALGNAYLDSRSFDGLLRDAAAYQALHPADFRGYYYEAVARQKLGRDAAQTEALARRSLELNPRFAAAHALLGKLLLDAGRPKDAVSDLEQAVRLRPEYTPAHMYLANAYKELGRMDDARREYAAVKRLKEQEDKPVPHLRYHRGNESPAPVDRQ